MTFGSAFRRLVTVDGLITVIGPEQVNGTPAMKLYRAPEPSFRPASPSGK